MTAYKLASRAAEQDKQKKKGVFELRKDEL